MEADNSQKRMADRVGSEAARTGVARIREALARSEQLTKAVLDSLAAHVAVLGPSGRIIITNAAWDRFARQNSSGPARRTGVGVDYLAVCREACGEASEGASEVLQALEGVLSGHRTNFQFEYPCHSPTEQRWFLLQATGLEGKAGGAVVLHIDITERKLMEGRLLENERLRVLTTGLINGQEDERRRIARDLHDGLNQDIASLSIDLGMLAMKAANPIREEVQAIQRRTFDLSEQIRRISHELHPPALEHLGLEASLRTLCEQFERNATFQVVFHRSGSLPGLSPAAALGLYRVAQECLRNAAKHAAAEHVSVSIGASGGFLRMAIHDDGRGFDPHASAGLGLGLASIDERVRQLGGMLRLTSTSGDGTSVEVRIPIDGAGE